MEKNTEFVEFKIRSADIIEASLNAQKEKLPKNPIFNFDIRLEHKINFEQQVILVDCCIQILHDKKEIAGKFKAGCVFDVNNLEDLKNKENYSAADLPSQFVTTINSLTISTVRGMMLVFFRGTYLHNAILPIIDPSSFTAESVPPAPKGD